MTNLWDSRFYDLLPPNLQGASTLALSYAVDRQMRKLAEGLRRCLILADVDHLEEDLCDYLALLMDIEAYSESFPLAAKRGLIKLALRSSSRKGTAGAVREVLSVIHGEARVEENWEYGGSPCCFRVMVEQPVERRMDREAIGEQIDSCKNIRSHMEGFISQTGLDPARLGAGGIYTGVSETRLIPLTWEYEAELTLRAAGRSENITQTVLPRLGGEENTR